MISKSKIPLFYRSAPFLWKLKKTIGKPAFNTIYRLRVSFNWLTSSFRAKPNFVIIGAQKCGTSSLHRTLLQHPELISSIKKEIHFFDNPENFKKGRRWYMAHFPLRLFIKLNAKIRGKRVLTFEATPSYIVYPHSARRLHEVNPDAKIIVMFRNPVDRAYSHYFHSYRPLLEKLSFEDAIEQENSRLEGQFEKLKSDEFYWSKEYARFSYKTRGRYAEQLERWFEYFPRDQFMIIDSSYYYKNTQKCYNEVLDFVGLGPFEPQGFKKKIYPSYDKMDPGTRNQLVEYFRPYNQDLFKLLDVKYDWDK